MEKQSLLHLEQAIIPDESENQELERRGSMEETRRILKEIDKINLSLGYTKRTPFNFPRLTMDGYFYPRQDFRPEFLTKPKLNLNRPAHQKSINPFNEQMFYYPAPYLHTPLRDAPMRFIPVYPVRINSNSIKSDKKMKVDDSVRLGTIIVLPSKDQRDGRSMEKKKELVALKAHKIKNNSGKKAEYEYDDDSIIEEFAEYEALGIPEALGITDDDEEDNDEERQVTTTTALPILVNDKFLNILKKGEGEDIEEDDDDVEDYVEVGVRKFKPPSLRAFNISNTFNISNQFEKFQNFTKKFSIVRGQEESLKESTTDSPGNDEIDYQETMEEQQENKEDEKSPFVNYLRPRDQAQLFKEGGLIIQRLRVRHGGIAIAGPGGVATAGR